MRYRLGVTPSQTVGPYFSMRLAAEGQNVLVSPDTLGDRIRIQGHVLDGDRKPIEDALLELWQANDASRYNHPDDDRSDAALDPAFIGFGRCATGFGDGSYAFLTIMPGAVPAPDGGRQAPHLNIVIQARGMLNPTYTRVYFPEEAASNAMDPVLRSVPAERRATLIAELIDDDALPTYRFDIRYQGADETVFFDV
jgi:protocatechuate 3,4-dioxygenase, alpha subunit